ncbi:MAG: protelomerase family protein, partial [Cycloclasticus sp.]
VDYPWLMATINSLLSPDTSKSISFSRLAVGIAFATGRRQIEVLYQGRFKQVGEYELEFSGAAKKRGGADYEKTYNIYTIVPAGEVISAIALLKEQPEIMALSVLDEMPETKRNTAINQKMGKTMNTAAKRVWGDNERKFKDSRSVWARIVFEQHFTQDKRWAKVDEDVFWHEQLCHEDIETQKAYKQFKIQRMGEEAVTDQPTGRLEMIRALMDNPGIQARGSLLKITKWAIDVIEKDSGAKISQHRIIQEVGSGRAVIKDWLTLAEPALAADAIQNKEVEKPPKKAPEKKQAPRLAVKPRLKVLELRPGMFEVEVIIGNATHKYVIHSTSQNDALQHGWNQYIDENTADD